MFRTTARSSRRGRLAPQPLDLVGTVPVAELRGVTAVTTDTSGVVAFAQHADTGAVHVTSSMDGVHWTEPDPLP